MMEIAMQTIRIIDYENNLVYVRETPETFSEYVRQLINFINNNTAVREYKTRSVNTEVISCIIGIIKNHQVDTEYVSKKIDLIAERLLLKEREAQNIVAHMDVNVQKGSLIQALLYDLEHDKYKYLLSKVEHTDFIDDSDFSFKSGFSKDTKKIWKSCLFDIEDLSASEFSAKIYSNTVAKYWYDNFLELDKKISDEVNTERAFRAIESTLNRSIKNISPRDHMIIRNSVIAYFRSHEHVDFDTMIQNTLESYNPIALEPDKMQNVINTIKNLPEKYKFDRQFNSINTVINSKIKIVYDVYQGIQLRITDAIENIDETIWAYRESDGNKYIKIKTDNELTFQRFSKTD